MKINRSSLPAILLFIFAACLSVAGWLFVYYNASCSGDIPDSFILGLIILIWIVLSVAAYWGINKVCAGHPKLQWVLIVVSIIVSLYVSFLLTTGATWHNAGFQCLTF